MTMQEYDRYKELRLAGIPHDQALDAVVRSEARFQDLLTLCASRKG